MANIANYNALSAIVNRIPQPIGKLEKPIIALMDEVVALAERIYKLQHEPDENLSQLAISRELIQMREGLAQVIFLYRKKMNDIEQSTKDSLLSEADVIVGLQINEYAAEIRGIFRQLDHTAKLQWIAARINEKDGASLAAVLSVPAVLTELSSAEVARYREQYQSRASNYGQLAHFKKVLERVYAVLDYALNV